MNVLAEPLARAALAGQLLLLLAVAIGHLREGAVLTKFVTRIRDWVARARSEGHNEVVRVPAACHRAATELTAGIRDPGQFDAALTRALAVIPASLPRLPVALLVLVDAGLAFLALTPLCSALLRSAQQISELWPAGTVPGPAAYAQAFTAVPEALRIVRDGALVSVPLVAGLIAVWALRWWLRRPVGRESKMVEAVLRAAIAARPEGRGPIAADIARLMVPPATFAGPFRAALLAGAAAVVAVGALVLSAERRIANDSPLVYRAWPAQRIGISPDVRAFIPHYPAGGPIPKSASVSLVATPDEITLAQDKLLTLDEGKLPERAFERIANVRRVLSRFRKREDISVDVAVLAHRDLRADVFIPVAQHLGQHHVGRLILVLERQLPGSAVRAGLVVRPPSGERPPPVAARVRIQSHAVQLFRSGSPAMTLDLASRGWSSTLGSIIRDATGITGGRTANERVLVETAPDVSYDKLVAVLSALDGACPSGVECGFPGFGLEFLLAPMPAVDG